MVNKKESNKKGNFLLNPIKLSEPIKVADGFTNLVETAQEKGELKENKNKPENMEQIDFEPVEKETDLIVKMAELKGDQTENSEVENNSNTYIYKHNEPNEKINGFRITTSELLKILDAESLNEIYELNDVLRASSLKLYSTLIEIADSRGRARIKNHELMSKAGIKGLATLYKQERWLMDLKLIEKKAKPGPHDGSSYVVYKLETLPLPTEIFEKFEEYLTNNGNNL